MTKFDCAAQMTHNRLNRGMMAIIITTIALMTCSCASVQRGPRNPYATQNVVKGTIAGAAIGAAGGAIAGDAGKGAAIGAAVGAGATILNEVFIGEAPCSRWPEGSAQYSACVRAYNQSSVEEAERDGRCAGGDTRYCGGHGGHSRHDDPPLIIIRRGHHHRHHGWGW